MGLVLVEVADQNSAAEHYHYYTDHHRYTEEDPAPEDYDTDLKKLCPVVVVERPIHVPTRN